MSDPQVTSAAQDFSKRNVSVNAPTRLHFGLLAFGNQEGRNFGGVGLMLKKPRIKIKAKSSDCFNTTGIYADRLTEFAQMWKDYTKADKLPDCTLKVTKAPPQHVGLGLGTQLGLSTAEALQRFTSNSGFSAMERAIVVNRAARSAVGTYGFEFGGLIVERGRLPNERISPLECRMDFPKQWRIALIRPEGGSGLSGESETKAFTDIPPVSQRTTDRLLDIIQTQLLPGLTANNFNQVTDAIEAYGHLAGSCFEAVQGGPYNGRLLNNRVSWLKKIGVRGIGQSSWGPTLFCFFESKQAAKEFQHSILDDGSGQQLIVDIVKPDNRGAFIGYS
ncbi:MAG: hypothetical protein CMJ76_02370 [Planctomycetaceae bacterium]|nr:hypothetical protein [Planctomycetaceae bacterium]